MPHPESSNSFVLIGFSQFSKFTITSMSESEGKMVNISTFYPRRPASDLDYQTSHI